MTKSKITSEGLQGFCNQQINLSLKSGIAINDPFGKPLKKLVGFATYDGASYSKDEEDVKNDHYTDAIGNAMRHQWKELSNELPKMMINRMKNDSF